uniref:VWFA domain-containing protein n=1 Tax=Panagrolaimus sp. JU765 TaxID=591449 RepID=A0AC34Q8U8_9BILA
MSAVAYSNVRTKAITDLIDYWSSIYMKNQDINKIWEAYDEYCLKEKFLICLDILKKIHQVFASYGFIGNLQAFSVLFLFEFHVEFSDESLNFAYVAEDIDLLTDAQVISSNENNNEIGKNNAQTPNPIFDSKFEEEECLPKLDLVFLLDSSGSIEEIYQEHVKWAVALVDALQIEPDAVHVAAVQYAGFPLTEFALGTYPSVEDIRQHLKQINFQSGVTRTGYALRKAEAELFREDRGARKDALKVIILFTDGLSVDDPLKPAAQLRDLKGVKIYVVSVSKDGFETEMSRIAGNKQNVFGPTELSRLRNALLNDAERARACSAIGASWFKKHDSVTLKPPSPLNGGLLPPLDFLELIGSKEEDSAETENKKKESSVKKVVGEVKPEVEFQRDDKKVVKTKNLPVTTAPKVLPEVIEPTTKSTTVKETTTVKVTTASPTVTKVLKPSTILPKKVKVEEQAKAFAVKNVESENTKDVFDMPEKSQKSRKTTRKLSTTTVAATTTTTLPVTKKFTKLRKSTTVKASTTVATTVKTTTVPNTTVLPIKTKKTRKTTLRSTTTPKTTTTTTTATTQKSSTRKFRPTLAKRVSTTTTQKLSTTKVTSTTPKPTTTKPKTTTRSRFARPQTIRNNAVCELDLLFIVDSSGSVQKIYDEQKAFLKEILEKTSVEENVHRVALLQFAGNSIQKTEWSFDAFQNSSNLIEALDRVRLITGTTYIGAALRNAEKLLYDRRQDVPTIVVLISDGFSQDDASQDAEKIRKLPNLDFYSINISDLTNNAYLAELVGDSSRVFAGPDVVKFKDLLTSRLKCR